MFNKYGEYNFTCIPKDLNYFSKKSWINDTIKSFSDSNIIIFNENNYFSWVLVDEDEKFWLPYEKLLFFKEQFNINKSDFLIIENTNDSEVYYVVIDGFLFYYGNDYYKSLDVFKEYNTNFYTTFGVGDVERECDYVLFDNNSSKKRFENDYCVKEENSEYSKNCEDLFFLWFEEKLKNRTKEFYRIVFHLFFIFLLNVLSFYIFYTNQSLNFVLNSLI